MPDSGPCRRLHDVVRVVVAVMGKLFGAWSKVLVEGKYPFPPGPFQQLKPAAINHYNFT